jgi:cytoskeletal protein CcmA (bactofilin family)
MNQSSASSIKSPSAIAPSSSQTLSTIGHDLSIEGQGIIIRCQGALAVNGAVQAELHGREISVGQTGVVQGSITADSVDVWGRVGGTIQGSRVVLHSSAQVDGDIHAVTLAVEDGAAFEGRSRKATEPARIAPRLTAGAASSADGMQSSLGPTPLPAALPGTPPAELARPPLQLR